MDLFKYLACLGTAVCLTGFESYVLSRDQLAFESPLGEEG